jgi:ribonuclease HI
MRPLQLDQELLLVCEANCFPGANHGSWRFALERLNGESVLDASDEEVGDNNRLSLWSVVRGLEAISGPASVTMLTSSRYVTRSMSESLQRWRSTDFHWDHYGQRLPITNADLWRRIDRVLDIHVVSACCVAAAPQVNRRIARDEPLMVHSQKSEVVDRRDTRESISDGLRRWLIGQCRAVTGSYDTVTSRKYAVA